MIKRIISSILGVVITVPLIFIGAIPLAVFVSIIGVIAALEMARLLKKIELSVHRTIAITATFLFIFIPSYFGEAGTVTTLILLAIYAIIMILFRKRIKLENTAATIFTALYIGFLLGRLILLREIPVHGIYFILITILLVWGNDTASFLFGKKFGKHKLAPSISPNKTIEGTIAGLAAALLIGIISSLIYKNLLFESMLLAILAATAAQFGDLFESQFKRWAKVKDSGNIVPGHGGMLDRIDGLLFAGSFSYYLALLLIRV